MNRRNFLATLLTSFTASALADDLDRLLWLPGQKLISVPKPTIFEPSLRVRPFYDFLQDYCSPNPEIKLRALSQAARVRLHTVNC